MHHPIRISKNITTDQDKLSIAEKRQYLTLAGKFHTLIKDKFPQDDINEIRKIVRSGLKESAGAHNEKNIPEALLTLNTALLFADLIEPDRNILLAIGLYPLIKEGLTDILTIKKTWGEDIAGLLTGLEAVDRFSNKNNVVNQDNFRGLMLALADDIRVIIIMIVRNLALMRMINNHPDDNWVRDVAFEANFLYAQLAHRLGLYKIKSELEDLSLKYTNREIYNQIAKKLNATKREREAYIKRFIDPVKEKLEKAGLKFDIKGRTKSISSIWNKMKKQKVDLPGIYDLFAIRVIIDTPVEKEKSDCWLAYSILADMYTANPARMRDWITIPKSNGYESLHATVLGPESKWVEVQFRTRRMDLVAEKGLAAHWRYKGVKGDSTDQWMNNIRDILESAESGPMQLMKDMKMDIYGKEVFAFTPKGDLFRLQAGATVLDFAFLIHSNVGAHCTGGIVNGQHRKITHKINNGDTIEILTSSTQSPKSDWLNIVVSSKARNKIKQSLNEEHLHRAEIGKELLLRRAKNRKIDMDDAILAKLILKYGFKHINDFFAEMADGKIDPGKFLASYIDEIKPKTDNIKVSAEEFQLHEKDNDISNSEILKIGEKNIHGLNYKFAKCCNPIYGDEVFGFISADGTVKIHRIECPNAANIRTRYPYRIIRTSWSGNDGDMLPVTLRITGKDDIGIVANITSMIAREPGLVLRNISVDSHDGMFQGILVVAVSDSKKLNSLLKKLSSVKGVKQIQRS
ncbi:MAG: bifunctional (p)ppGpp synthetase/guanosine-3',5'-bis(diphosphate) 3'-pyrophosphohydrolase [Muribaculaceae bacterium]|nr:bifunctional (p)ppGpp synthetase/guanosine-3',5'-bis(diphosphate) 3'-pyrophosphohydrolase [Muribaculaceae bacterium]